MNTKEIKIAFSIYCILFLLMGISENYYAQDNFSINASIQMVGGNYSDSLTHNRSYYLNGGIRYQAQNFVLSLNIPFVATGNQAYTQIGGMYLPNNNNSNSLGDQIHGQGSHGSMMSTGNNSISSYNFGIGDLYLNGTYNLFKDNSELMKISFDGYVKIPTASSSLNIGTGKFDYSLGITGKKIINTFLFYTQIGYLILGKVSGSDLKNPITLSVGVGKVFDSGKQSILIGYDSYSTIVAGIPSPKQISLGYNYMFSPSISYIVIGSLGLSNSTSDYSLAGGINFGI